MLELLAQCDKAAIAQLQKMKGLGNGDTCVSADGVEFEPGTLIFRGFVAPPPTDGSQVWHGKLLFEPGESMECYRKPMAFLFQNAEVEVTEDDEEEAEEMEDDDDANGNEDG